MPKLSFLIALLLSMTVLMGCASGYSSYGPGYGGYGYRPYYGYGGFGYPYYGGYYGRYGGWNHAYYGRGGWGGGFGGRR